jgi:hypothetical protein
VAVDTLGLLWALMVVPASVQDRVVGLALVERLHTAVKRIKKLWGDSHFDTALRASGKNERFGTGTAGW